MPKEGDLRVWWIPQVPMQPFHVPVKNVDEAILILNTLADYDLFQFNNKVKPDYCNAGGLEQYEIAGDGENDGWYEYYDDEERDIDEIIEARAEPITGS